jgi:hypothetical protein
VVVGRSLLDSLAEDVPFRIGKDLILHPAIHLTVGPPGLVGHTVVVPRSYC